jgi:hypothetical protein
LVLTATFCVAQNSFTEIQVPEYYSIDYPSGTLEVFAELEVPLNASHRIAISRVYNNPNWVTGTITRQLLYGSMYRLNIPYLQNQTNETREAYVRIDLEHYVQEWDEWEPYNTPDTYFFLHVYQFGAIANNPYQTAINNAANGSTINIPAGEFVGHLTISNKTNLTIKGAGFESTTIRSSGHRSTISITNSTNLKIMDMTIANGIANDGGGVHVAGSTVTIDGCLIKDNSTQRIVTSPLVPPETKGGAIYVASGSCNINSTTILDNEAELGKTAYVESGQITFNACTLLENTTASNYESTGGQYTFLNSIISSANLNNSVFNYCCSYDGVTLPGFKNINEDPMFVNPAIGDYSLQKGSPCIGKGYNPAFDDPQVAGFDQDLITILDETQDIGAMNYPMDRYAEYTFTDDPQGNWVCFPVLDDISMITINGMPFLANSMRAFFYEYEVPNSPMNAVGFTEYQTGNFQVLWHTPQNPKTNLMFGHKGYKAIFNQDSTMDEIHGYHIAYNTPVPVPEPSVESWIGYFIPETQTPQVAFGSFLDELYYIQHKDWSMVRIRPKRGDPWIVVAPIGQRQPTISYGDMVIVKKFGASIGYPEVDEFTWTRFQAIPRFVRTESEFFSYEKTPEYKPIFVEIDELSTAKEIAVLIDGVCYGAAVVDGDIIMIQAFIDAIPQGAEMQLVAWDGAKAKSSPLALQVYNSERDALYQASSILKQDCDYYYVKLGDNGDPDTPELTTMSVGNYPNPFNPSTTISYSVPADGDVSITIYNAKGQLVSTLVNEHKIKGNYQVVWQGKDMNGRSVATGLYFTRLVSRGKAISSKMLLMK